MPLLEEFEKNREEETREERQGATVKVSQIIKSRVDDPELSGPKFSVP